MKYLSGCRRTLNRLRSALGVRAAFAARRPHGNVAVTAVRAGLCVLIAVGTPYALGAGHLAPYAALGCFTALYARDDSYARRRRVLAAVGSGLALAVAAGGAAALSGSLALSVLVVAAVAGAAKFASDAFDFGAPAGLMFVFAAGVAGYAPQTPAALPAEIAATAAAAALCWCAALAGALAHPLAPQRLAVARALIAVARRLEAPASAGQRRAAHQALRRAWAVLAQAPGRRAHRTRQLALLTARAEALAAGTGDSVADARTAAELCELARRIRRRRRIDPLARSGERAVLGVRAEQGRAAAPGPAPARARMAAAARAGSPTRTAVLRIGVAAAASGAVGALAGIEHGYWAAVSAGSVLQSVDVTSTWHRMLQRGTGTAAGALIAAALFAGDLPPWAIVALVALLQALAELVVTTNYGYAIVFATPLTIGLSQLAQPVPPGALVAERVTATLLGAVIGVAVALALANRSNAARLSAALADCRRAAAAFSAAGPAEREDGLRDRLGSAVAALAAAHGPARGEPWVARVADAEVAAAEDEAHRLLADLPAARAPAGAR